MNYSTYTAEAFAADESFQDYYLDGEEKATLFWTDWMAAHPNKATEITEAKKLLDTLTINVGPEEMQLAYQALNKQIEAAEQTSEAKLVRLSRQRTWWTQIAGIAAVLLAVLSTAYFFWPTPQADWQTHQTAFGEIQEIYLPDSSLVTLNANSVLRYDQNWRAASIREIWLEGEAFFKVRKNPVRGNRQFVVYSDETKVKVLGTSFNVYSRNERVEVVLASGKVDVEYSEKGAVKNQKLLPNDRMVLLTQREAQLEHDINTSLFTAWKDKRLILDKTPLKKVVDILQENFGYEVEIANPQILERQLTATIPVVDIDLLLAALREIYGLNISKQNQKIRIE
ncbi:MAG: FecR domain-containing protein [Bacteroidota bacterium]